MSQPRPSAHELAALVRAHPAVVELSGGPYSTIATHLPGARLLGVRIGEPGEPVEIAVVLRLAAPLPRIVEELRRAVSARCGGAAVDVTVSDVVTEDTTDTEATRRARPAPPAPTREGTDPR